MVCVCVSEMMESCLAGKPERVGPVEVDDIRRDLLGEFAALPAQVGLPVWADLRRMLLVSLEGVTDVMLFCQQDGDQSQSENLQVYLRVRPFTVAENDSGESQVTQVPSAYHSILTCRFLNRINTVCFPLQECVTIEGPDTVVLKAPRSCQSHRQSEKSLPQTAQRFTFTQVTLTSPQLIFMLFSRLNVHVVLCHGGVWSRGQSEEGV